MSQMKFRAWDGERYRYPEDGTPFKDSEGVFPDDVIAVTAKNYGWAWEQSCGLTDATGAALYAGDIVEFTANRATHGTRSKHDGKNAARGLIVFRTATQYSDLIVEFLSGFHIDTNNAFNARVKAARGSEAFDRDFWGAWGREMRLVGNVRENPELLS